MTKSNESSYDKRCTCLMSPSANSIAWLTLISFKNSTLVERLCSLHNNTALVKLKSALSDFIAKAEKNELPGKQHQLKAGANPEDWACKVQAQEQRLGSAATATLGLRYPSYVNVENFSESEARKTRGGDNPKAG